MGANLRRIGSAILSKRRIVRNGRGCTDILMSFIEKMRAIAVGDGYT
jgi:hypothetical protein